MDKNFYDINDMAKVGCNDCKGCFNCCQGMGYSIVLDPYDIWQLETNLSCSFAELMMEKIELHVVDGLIMPNLKMQGTSENCVFLNQEGRCGIHGFRPGLCRLFPLGRNYEENKLNYFLLEGACPHSGHTKSKIKKWLEIPDSRRYEEFLINWHTLRKKLREEIAGNIDDDNENPDELKDINMKLLHIFYEAPYLPEDFYGQFAERMSAFMQE